MISSLKILIDGKSLSNVAKVFATRQIKIILIDSIDLIKSTMPKIEASIALPWENSIENNCPEIFQSENYIQKQFNTFFSFTARSVPNPSLTFI